MVGLDGVVGAHPPDSDEVGGAQGCHRHRSFESEAADLERHFELEGPAGQGHHFEQSAGVDVQVTQARKDETVEGGGRAVVVEVFRQGFGGAAEVGDGVFDQLGDKKGAALGFPGDRTGQHGVGGGHRPVAEGAPIFRKFDRRQPFGEQVAGEAGGGVFGKFGHLQLATSGEFATADRFVVGRVEQGLKERARVAFFAAKAAEQEERRGFGWAQQLGEQAGAVAVAPLQVVDHQDQRAADGQPAQQFAQGAVGAAALLAFVGHFEDAAFAAFDGLDAVQHGEKAGEGPDIGWQEAFDFAFGQVPQVAGEGVEQGVEGFVGHGFAFVAAALEAQKLGSAGFLAVEEVLDEGAFAHARTAMHPDDGGVALLATFHGFVEHGEVGLAADEEVSGFQALGQAAGDAQPVQHFLAIGPGRRIVRQEGLTEFDQIGRQSGHEGGGGGCVAVQLGVENLGEGTDVGPATGEHLEEQDTDGIPVAGGFDGEAAELFGRHVGRGAGQLEGHVAARNDFAHQAEIEQHDAAVGGDPQVRGFEVAVHLAGSVQGSKTLGELDQGGAQFFFVGGRRRWGAVGFAAHPLEEVDAGHHFHGEEPGIAVSLQLVKLGEVRMDHVGQRTELVFEAQDGLRVGAKEGFEGDLVAKTPIENAKNLARSASSEALHGEES